MEFGRFVDRDWLLLVSGGQVGIGCRHDGRAHSLATLIDEAWEFTLREDPLFATNTGDHRYDDQLPKVSLADEKRRDAARRGFLARLEAIDRDALTPTDQVNYDIFGRSLRDDIRDYEFQLHLMPVTDRYGFHIEFPELPRNLPLATVRDYENYIARLSGFATYAAGHIELMREGVRQGMTVPSVIMQRYNEPLEAQIVDDPEKSLLYAPFREFPPGVPESEHERLRDAGRKAIAESVVPGYRQFLKFMKDEYVPNCRGTIAASALPRGRDFYRYCVGKFTTLDDLTPEEVHAIGQAEVERIRGEMDEIIRDVKFDGDFAAFTEFLRTDPKFYAKTAEELEKEVAFALKRMDGAAAEAVRPLAAHAVRRAASARLHRAASDVRLLSIAHGRRPPCRLLLHQHVQPAEPAAVHARSAVAARGGARPSFADRAAAGAGGPAELSQVRRLHRVRRRLGAVLRAARAGKRLLQRSVQRLRPADDGNVAGLPAGGRHRHALPRLDARAGDRIHARQLGDAACTTSAPKSTATSAGPARRWRTKSAS